MIQRIIYEVKHHAYNKLCTYVNFKIKSTNVQNTMSHELKF